MGIIPLLKKQKPIGSCETNNLRTFRNQVINMINMNTRMGAFYASLSDR
jgi:hypothetical protein